MTRDELVEALRLHRGEIVEAEEWRPLADHVLELVNVGILRAEYTAPEEVETARGVLLKVRETLEEQLGQQQQHVGDPTWKQPEETRTEIKAINVSRLALDALAREPVLQVDLERLIERDSHAEEYIQKMQETIDGISAGIIKPPSLETCLKLIQAEGREKLLVGLLRLVADEGVCDCVVVDKLCTEHWPDDPGEWCPVCFVRKSLEDEPQEQAP